eukprot:11692955-Alexandrium_andersonii.AAC.1
MQLSALAALRSFLRSLSGGAIASRTPPPTKGLLGAVLGGPCSGCSEQQFSQHRLSHCCAASVWALLGIVPALFECSSADSPKHPVLQLVLIACPL